MNIEQLGLQLGIAGALIVVGYRLAVTFIDRWAKVEDKKTDALATGLKAIVDKIDAHTHLDLASHNTLTQSHAEMTGELSRFTGSVNARFERLEGVMKQQGTVFQERWNALLMHLDITPPPPRTETLPPPRRDERDRRDRDERRDHDREREREREDRRDTPRDAPRDRPRTGRTKPDGGDTDK